ncbi:MAG TPA: glycosyltransferase family 4 protein [Vicinamibacterales bacterium]|nr:glycosyltransferase family 4 protein [Vicinamibacterales bacterium]
MRIAQVAPLFESVPPKLYGGTERIVSFLTNELVRLGHDVTLFASGDSATAATLVPGSPRALRLSECRDDLTPHVLMLEQVAQRAAEFDVIHFHVAPLHYPIARRLPGVAHVTTLHGRLDLEHLPALYDEFADAPLVAISGAQRRSLPDAGWIGTIHHGLPPTLFRFRPRPGGYFAFLGRISPEKRVDRAIEIATACRCPLRIAAKVDAADRDYFDREIKPLLDNPYVQFIGEIGEDEKDAFLGGARALLFPIDWPEPFGIVMIEALACGLPVIAFDCGSVREVIDHGVTGFIVNTMDEAIRAAQRVAEIDRAACRAVFDRRFTVNRMTTQYVRIYRRLAASSSNRVA